MREVGPKSWGSITSQIVATLEQLGPMTLPELTYHIAADVESLRKAANKLTHISRRGPEIGKRRIHIMDWTRDAEGVRAYPRAIYAAGHGENKKRPRPKPHKTSVRDWKRKKNKLATHNFVFNLGIRP